MPVFVYCLYCVVLYLDLCYLDLLILMSFNLMLQSCFVP